MALRRRREPKPAPPATPGSKTIRVVCTGKGQHPVWLFGRVTVRQDDNGAWHLTETTFGAKCVSADLPVSPVEISLTERTDLTLPLGDQNDGVQAVVRIRAFPRFVLLCRRCGQRHLIRVDSLEELCTQDAAIDTTKVDLSDLS